MNLANEVDLAMDEAIKRHLGKLFDGYFQSQGDQTTKINQLSANIKQLESDAVAAEKSLDI